ncbi:MAG: hypothetical protein KKD44_29090 [Proteobacteria bacterium]|nr:hypothetical protein [Pseudomonadota bacterium]
MKRVIKTTDLRKRKKDDRLRPGGGFIATGRPRGLTGTQYIEKYGLPEEIEEFASLIAARRNKLPRFSYWLCESCGWKAKLLYDDRDFEPDLKKYCLRCNPHLYIDGSFMRPMTKKEAAQYEKDTVEDFKKGVDRMQKAAFYTENENRQKQGFEPLTRAEWDERRRQAWQAQKAAYRLLS